MVDLVRLRKAIKLQFTPESRKVHFLHVCKAAGTVIKLMSEQIEAAHPQVVFKLHGHKTRLGHLPSDARWFFSIRQPHERFQSGFLSRKRMGQPRHFNKWSPHEAMAFARFSDPCELAESLFSVGPDGDAALCAIKSLTHTSDMQINWIDFRGYFLKMHPPIFILRQEKLEEDAVRFARRLGYSGPLLLSDDPVKSHRSDPSTKPILSEKALQNLRRWYAQDYAFYDLCEGWILSQSD